MKKTMKSFVIIAVLAIVSVGTANAQLGVQAGYVSSKFVAEDSEADPYNGFNVGLTYDMAIQGGFGLHYGLLYTLISDKESVKETLPILGDVEVTYKSSGHFLNIPVQATYKYAINSDFGIFAYAGPNFTMGVAGSEKISYSIAEAGDDGKASWYGEDDGIDFGRFDIQLGVGLGIQYSNFVLKGGYDWGLLNPYGDDDFKINRNQFNVSLGFLF